MNKYLKVAASGLGKIKDTVFARSSIKAKPLNVPKYDIKANIPEEEDKVIEENKINDAGE